LDKWAYRVSKAVNSPNIDSNRLIEAARSDLQQESEE